jgi:dTDP-glucose 4,6-dehydratase
MRILITGGAGFIGSHLCDALLARGDEVVAVDNFVTGNASNLANAQSHHHFQLIVADVTKEIPVDEHFDCVVHLASPASPNHYLRLPLETMASSSRGTELSAELALANQCRFIFASTSEVYGDPLEHPQRESYWGNVNPIGPRSVYDEAKRFGEALTCAYGLTKKLDVGIVRIFNTYGPRLQPDDGRVVSNLILQALSGQPMTIFGDGSQTRSFCFVDDTVAALVAMILATGVRGPINIGNPFEHSVLELAELIRALTGSNSSLEFLPLPVDDPKRRCPDITRAKELLGWLPQITIHEGIAMTSDWLRSYAESARALQ